MTSLIHHQITRMLSACLLISTANAAEDFSPGLFAFQNGCRFESLEQEIETLKRLGYVGIGSAYLNRLEERIEAYHKAGMKFCSIYVGAYIDGDGGRIDEGIPAAIQLLKGTDAIVELTIRGKADNAEEQAVKLIRQVADLAADAGLRVALYPHQSFYVERIPEAIHLIEKVERENVGITFNLCHFLMCENNADLEAAIETAKHHLFQVTTCGADNDGKNWKQLIQTLDQGSFDHMRLIRAMDKAGFKGRVGLQCYQVEGESADILARSIKAWGVLLENHATQKGKPR